jgi:Mn-dependent DtxR family transcriptional regulator
MTGITDEIRKTLSDPKPLYALAGAGDLAAEKLKDAPERLKDAPALIAEAGATLTTIANKIAAEAPERFAKASATVQGVATKGLRPDTQALRGAAQTVALQQVGRLLEAAGKAVETYDELAERGKVVVARYNGGTETVPGETADAERGPVKVVVEQVFEEDEITEAPVETAKEAAEAFEGETAEEAAEVFEAAAEAAGAAKAAKPATPRKTAAAKPAAKKATPRKSTTAPKTPRSPKA